MNSRKVKESPLEQGVDEQISYTLTTTPWGSAPVAVAVKAYDTTTSFADVSATVLSGAASVGGDVITLPLLKSLTLGHTYRVEVKFTVNGNIMEAYFEVLAGR